MKIKLRTESAVLLSFNCHLDPKQSHLGRRKLNWGIISINFACGCVWESIAWLTVVMGGPTMVSTNPTKVTWKEWSHHLSLCLLLIIRGWSVVPNEIRDISTQTLEQGLVLISTRGGKVWTASKPWLSSLDGRPAFSPRTPEKWSKIYLLTREKRKEWLLLSLKLGLEK